LSTFRRRAGIRRDGAALANDRCRSLRIPRGTSHADPSVTAFGRTSIVANIFAVSTPGVRHDNDEVTTAVRVLARRT